jgi:hypothetical protein
MISSQEFQQKIQAGQIHEALALAIQAASELDITTRMTEDSPDRRSAKNEYIRTKINLLTGNVENEVGKKVLTDSNSYLKLQQLHIDRVADSHRIVRGYLQQLEAILTALPPITTSATSEDASIPTRSTALATTPIDPPQLPTAVMDEDVDLSLEREGEVWEEWVEEEDFQFEVGSPSPSLGSPGSMASDRSAHSVRRPLNPLPLKPIALRSTATPVDNARWDKFVPEYISVDVIPAVRPMTVGEVDRMDELLADLDP